MSDEYHFIQRKILNDLLFSAKLKYSQLKPSNMEGSLFTFHLKKLIDSNLIVKTNEYYTLTAKGKTVANSFDIDSNNPNKQAKHSAIFCAFRQNKGKIQTLLYTRKKNPYFDHQGYPTGKVMYGESIIETAERELIEETSLVGKAQLVGIRHIRVYYPTSIELVEDKVMYVCRIDNPKGKIVGNKEGEFYWVDIGSIEEKIKKPLPEFSEVFQMLNNFNGQISFLEINRYPRAF